MPIRMLNLVFLGALALSGCAPYPMDPLSDGVQAAATLSPTQGSTVQGRMHFSKQPDGSVRVSGSVQGLPANSVHGFHLHEKGDCSAPDGSSAGGHFNPMLTAHGAHGAGHAGDLPSLRADGSGVARFDFSSRSITVGHGRTDVIGQAVIVHQNADDFTTQPTGNAGGRLACGVVTRANSSQPATP